jgi:hypothetical protein
VNRTGSESNPVAIFRISDVEPSGFAITVSCNISGCNQKFPDWPPGAKTANGIVLCH